MEAGTKKVKHQDEVLKLYKKGVTFSEIGRLLGMTKSNAHRIVQASGFPSRNPRGCCSAGKCAFAKAHGCKLK